MGGIFSLYISMIGIAIGCFWFSSSSTFTLFAVSWCIIKFCQASAFISVPKIANEWYQKKYLAFILALLYSSSKLNN
jgi:hypothetical protein